MELCRPTDMESLKITESLKHCYSVCTFAIFMNWLSKQEYSLALSWGRFLKVFCDIILTSFIKNDQAIFFYNSVPLPETLFWIQIYNLERL